MATNSSSDSAGHATDVAADAPLRHLKLPAHLVFLVLMFLLPALFGRFLFLRFTLPLAHKLGIHPAVSSVLLVNVLMLFELALLLAAFYWVQHGRRWQQLRRATYVWPIDWKGTAWSPLLCFGIFIVLGAWGTLAQPRILAFMQGIGFWKGRNIILELNSMSPPATTVAVVLIYLSWAILGAFVEEAYFRGYLQSQMSFAGRFDWVLGGRLSPFLGYSARSDCYGSRLVPGADIQVAQEHLAMHLGKISPVGRAIYHLPERHGQASLKEKSALSA